MKASAWFALIASFVVGGANPAWTTASGTATASAPDISGTITSTLTIFEDAQLVGNVTCMVAEGPCIAIRASGIALRLNGFALTGPAEPPTNCATSAALEDGIAVVGQSDVAILGPGLVQSFRRHGMFLSQSSGVTVRQVTSAHHCFSGMQLAAVTNSDIEENVSVGNAVASGVSPCGGTCINNSHNNRFRWNTYSGNGSVEPENNDFGIGLVGTSSGNLIEENVIGGNTNGVLIQAGASGNLIRRNTIVGNPPAQVSAVFGAAIGADVTNQSPAGSNTFDDNLCLTYSGPAPAPCPNIPNVR
jgi:parallel beta-helix repeat protein